MCGIVGLLGSADAAIGEERVHRATRLTHHRGPDDAGVVAIPAGPVFGHNRLSILDLTDHAHQPMRLADEGLWLIFNGEIYNYVELRADLESRGRRVTSTGDSEVILHAYAVWGEECVSRFNGMWAFALWDERRDTLFLSRDRFGVKPLYLAESRYGFAWASEIKALLALDPDLAEPDESTLFRFLLSGLLDEGEATFFRRVRQLPPAHSMVIGRDGSRRVWRYYDVAEAALGTDVDMRSAAGDLRELMTDAVRLRLRADVPVGTCLSGGIDSSAIVGLADQLMDRRVSSFTSIYPGTDSDESAFARDAADLYRTDAHWVEPQKSDFFDVLPRLVWHQDEPTSAPGLYSQWHVMQLAHGTVKVLLDGQGGDEVFAGYLGHYADYTASLLGDIARGRFGRLGRLVREYPEIRTQLGGKDPFLAAAATRAPVWLRGMARGMRGPGHGPGALIAPQFYRTYASTLPAPILPDAMSDALNSSLVDSLVRSSIPSLLHYEDRNSMAFSIEARVPFLDYRLVEFGLATPYWAKIRGWETKVIFREAMGDILPPSILARRDKKGYPTPLALWLREGLMPQTRDILLSPEARGRGLLVPAEVERLLAQHEAGSADHHWQIWRLLTLELWYRTFIDSRANAPVTL